MSRFPNVRQAHLLAHTLGMRLYPGQPVRVDSGREAMGFRARLLVAGEVIRQELRANELAAVEAVIAYLEHEDRMRTCPGCGSREVTTWAEDGESVEADHAECEKCSTQWALMTIEESNGWDAYEVNT